MSEEIVRITPKDLSKVEDNSLNINQLKYLLAKTPKTYIKSRPAKGGGTWNYVDGAYVKKVLNLMFGWDWDFEIIEQMMLHGEAIVKGRLTCRSNGRTIVKMQFGNKDIVFKKGTEIPLSIGNDFKAAATDSLKKCAAELGIAQDVYNPESYKQVNLVSEEYLRMERFLKNASNLNELELLKDECFELGMDKEYSHYVKLLL
jgi:hypothetical protein